MASLLASQSGGKEKINTIDGKRGKTGLSISQNITMEDKDHNRFESNKTWIEWKSLNDGETLLYCQKNYNKPRDEEALKKKIKDKMKESDERTRKRQGDAGPKRSRVKCSDGIERVENHNKWKEWMNLDITGSMSFKNRTYKKDVAVHWEQLMDCIIKSTEYNKSHYLGKKEVATVAKELVDMGRGGGRDKRRWNRDK